MMSNSNNDCFVIVIGETGTGKSTFINYVANALKQNSSLDALEVVIPNEHYPRSTSSEWKHNERALDDSTLSKTAECQRYSFPSPTGKSSFVLIDTPGLGDTSGHLKDNKNVGMIFETIKSLQQISAIILILNGTIPRMTSSIANVLSRFRQFFPNSIYTNMIVVLTNCQKYNVSFDLDSLNLPPTCRFFYMQNSVYCQSTDTINKHRASFEQDFNESMMTMHTIIKYLLQLQPQTTKAFADLNDERYRLQAFLHESHLMILEMEQLENELESLKKAADLGKMNVDKLLQQSQISILRTVSKDYNNIICGQCNRVCHKRCKLNEIPRDGDNPISTCSKMKDGHCTQCRCSIDLHYYDSKDMEIVQRPAVESITRAEQRLRFEQEDHASTVSKYKSVEAVKIHVQNLFDRQCDQIRLACMNLKKSCQNINIAQELNNFIRILNQGRLQLHSPLVADRLYGLIEELERIVSDCQQTSKNNGDNNLHCNTQIQTSVEAPPPLPLRQTGKQQAPVKPPPYYQPDRGPELNSTSKTIKRLPIQPQRYSAYSTERLIGAHQELMRTHSEYAKRTLCELHQRARGNSVGLLNRSELIQLANHYADRRHHDKNDLQEEYDALANKINADINHDASHLENAEPDDLLKMAALSLIINPVTQI